MADSIPILVHSMRIETLDLKPKLGLAKSCKRFLVLHLGCKSEILRKIAFRDSDSFVWSAPTQRIL